MWSPPQAEAPTEITHLPLVSWLPIIVALVANVGIQVALVGTGRVGIKSCNSKFVLEQELTSHVPLWA